MITKEKAIEILDTYLRTEYTLDPIYGNPKANRVTIYEEEYWWQLYQSPEGQENNSFGGQIGGYMYFITKDSGDIFALGLFDKGEWSENYIQYKKGQIHAFNWEPVRSEYLDCQQLIEKCIEYNPIVKEISYENKTSETQRILYEIGSENDLSEDETIKFRYVAIDGIKSKLKIDYCQSDDDRIGVKQVKKLVALKFTGGYGKMKSTLLNVKKWIRVNRFLETDNYWVEVNSNEMSKKFEKWNLIMKMEIKNKK